MLLPRLLKYKNRGYVVCNSIETLIPGINNAFFEYEKNIENDLHSEFV